MNLNSQQEIATSHGLGPMLVLAGPGSGKTRVLVSRIANLVETGLAYPSQILAVTFTNKAAGEMRARLENIIGPRAREISAGTFHSICLKLLRKHSELLGLGVNFIVFDESDQTALIKRCMAELNLDAVKIEPRAVVERISRAKDACLLPKEFEKQAAGNFYLEKLSRIYSLYQRKLTELQAADFGDLIMQTVKLFEREPKLLESYQKRWLFVLVDEYQDTNHAQYKLVSMLASGHKNIFAVGDDDQSIYRWRGADVSNILRFEADFPGSAVVRLEQNYRSTKSILAAARSVIARNAGRKKKDVWTDNGDGEKVTLFSVDSERSEAEEVTRQIRRLVDAGATLRDVAIFYRTNAQSRPFEEVFRRQSIPYKIYGGMKFYERAEVKDVLAYLKLIADPHDDVSFTRIVNVPARGIGDTTVTKLSDFARAGSMCLLAAIRPFAESLGVQARASRKLLEFESIVKELALKAPALELDELAREVIERTGYIEALAKSSTIEAEGKIENINELVAAMEEFVPDGENAPLTQFLDQVALVSEADKIDETQGTVTMMTVHLAKGLEYPSVFIVGLEEGLFPHARSLDDPDELEEERRLCYVGMTRAKKNLFLSHAFKRSHFGSERYNVASRFLEEIPENLLIKRTVSGGGYAFVPRAKVERPKANISLSDFDFDQRPTNERESPFSKGSRVSHPVFGSGVIFSCEKTSAGHRVTVRFGDGQLRRLIAECAGLTVSTR